MPRIKNVSALGALDVPSIGRVVEFGEVVEVSDEVAGHAPCPFRPATDEDPVHLTRVLEDGSVEAYDPGAGLLATGHFVVVDDPKPAVTKKSDPLPADSIGA